MLWDASTGAEQLPRLQGGHAGATCCAFSPDSRLLASGGRDCALRLWDVATGAEPVVIRSHSTPVTCCAFSPDGRYVASGSEDDELRLSDSATGAVVRELPGHPCGATCCSFSPAGSFLVAGCLEASVLNVWDVATGALQRTLDGHIGCARCCCFSPDGKFLVSGSEDCTLKAWLADSGKEVVGVLGGGGHSAYVVSCAWSFDGSRLVSGASDALKIWDAVSIRKRDDERLLWAAQKQAQPLLNIESHSGAVTGLALVPGGGGSAVSAGAGTLALWGAPDVSDKRPRVVPGARVLVPAGAPRVSSFACCAVSRDGGAVATASLDEDTMNGDVIVWSAATGAELWRAGKQHHNGAFCCCFSPDGRAVLSGGAQELRLWDAAAGALLLEAPVEAWATACAFSPDGRTVAIGDAEGSVRLLGAASLAKEGSADKDSPMEVGHSGAAGAYQPGWVHALAFSPDGALLVSASEDGTLKVWRADTGAEAQSLAGHAAAVTACRWPSPDTIVSASRDGSAKWWRSATPPADMAPASARGAGAPCGEPDAAEGDGETPARASLRFTCARTFPTATPLTALDCGTDVAGGGLAVLGTGHGGVLFVRVHDEHAA